MKLSALPLLFLLASCASQPPPPVIVQAPAPAPTPQPIPPDPYVALPSDVTDAIKHHQTPVFHHGVTTIFPYSADTAYALNCQPLHVTQIRLEGDETTTKDNVKVGDITRWGVIVGDHAVLVFPLDTTQTISIPGSQVTIPPAPSMITNLIISTSKGRSYVFNPVKIGKPFTQAVSFYYSDDVRAQNDAHQAALKAQEVK